MEETRLTRGEIIGFARLLDGQTTNPDTDSKKPEAKERLRVVEKFSEKEIYRFYRDVP